jgi:ABC-type nitrate/sulfonate/bicarbonate transport system substrate-binding protein
MPRMFRVFSAIVGATLALGACASGTDRQTRTDSASSSPIDTVRISQIQISYSAVTQLAFLKGFFRDEGLVVQVASAPAGPDVVTQLRQPGRGAPLIGTIAITPVATMLSAGNDPVILATTVSSHRAAQLVTFAGSGVSARPQSLRGKRIGVVNNTNGDIYLSRLLTKGGLTSRNVTLVNARPADLVSLLVNGDIDAAVLWDPFISQVRRRHAAAVDSGRAKIRGATTTFVDSTLHTLEFNVVTTRSQLQTREPQLRRFLRACVRAGEYIKSNRSAAQAEVEQWLGLNAGDLSDFFNSADFDVHLDVTGVKSRLADELSWLRARNPSVSAASDLTPYVDGSILSSIDVAPPRR